jgi:hypothetical protein
MDIICNPVFYLEQKVSELDSSSVIRWDRLSWAQ